MYSELSLGRHGIQFFYFIGKTIDLVNKNITVFVFSLTKTFSPYFILPSCPIYSTTVSFKHPVPSISNPIEAYQGACFRKLTYFIKLLHRK